MSIGAEPERSVGAFLCQAGRMLRAAGVEAPRLEARLLLAHALRCREEDLLRDPAAPVPAEAAAVFEAAVRRRCAREPLAHILGRQGFWTLDLEVSPATLIPRADSEAVVEAALAAVAGRGPIRRVLDLGTGTGALLLAILAEIPSAWGVGVDLSAEAVALAARNAAANGLAGRAAFVVGSWADALAGRFDLVVSNPPYIPSADIDGLMAEVARYEPRRALDGGADGLAAYARIMAGLSSLLSPAGVAVFELGSGQRSAVAALAHAHGLREIGIRHDLGGVERAIILAGQEAALSGEKNVWRGAEARLTW
jgi:release factor glutamine methyltransferase